MAYLSQEQLESIGFKKLGRKVKISDKASIYNPECIEIGNNTRVDDFCVLSGTITLGAYVHIAPLCLLAGGIEGIIIGDFSGVSYGSKIFSQSDDYSGEYMASPLIPPQYKNEFKAKVSIARHTLIGANALVFPGVHIAEGCSIGALSLVIKSTEPWGIYVGIPAKRIKEKSKAVLSLEQQFLDQVDF